MMMPPRSSPAEMRAGVKLWGSRPAVSEGADLPPAKAAMKLAKFTPIMTVGAALAFLDIEQASGLITRDWKLMRGPDGKLWLAAPSVKQTNREGNPILGDKGKPLYRNFVDFKDRATRDRFTEQVINLVRREHPDIVGDEV
jgi:hypothetical protein